MGSACTRPKDSARNEFPRTELEFGGDNDSEVSGMPLDVDAKSAEDDQASPEPQSVFGGAEAKAAVDVKAPAAVDVKAPAVEVHVRPSDSHAQTPESAAQPSGPAPAREQLAHEQRSSSPGRILGKKFGRRARELPAPTKPDSTVSWFDSSARSSSAVSWFDSSGRAESERSPEHRHPREVPTLGETPTAGLNRPVLACSPIQALPGAALWREGEAPQTAEVRPLDVDVTAGAEAEAALRSVNVTASGSQRIVSPSGGVDVTAAGAHMKAAPRSVNVAAVRPSLAAEASESQGVAPPSGEGAVQHRALQRAQTLSSPGAGLHSVLTEEEWDHSSTASPVSCTALTESSKHTPRRSVFSLLPRTARTSEQAGGEHRAGVSGLWESRATDEEWDDSDVGTAPSSVVREAASPWKSHGAAVQTHRASLCSPVQSSAGSHMMGTVAGAATGDIMCTHALDTSIQSNTHVGGVAHTHAVLCSPTQSGSAASCIRAAGAAARTKTSLHASKSNTPSALLHAPPESTARLRTAARAHSMSTNALRPARPLSRSSSECGTASVPRSSTSQSSCVLSLSPFSAQLTVGEVSLGECSQEHLRTQLVQRLQGSTSSEQGAGELPAGFLKQWGLRYTPSISPPPLEHSRSPYSPASTSSGPWSRNREVICRLTTPD
eukprot:TRINITY_DN10546_c0_g1_i4.p1 TRINITY_DN10546_c0_g1~~TRINITY_DN10546_c0_g1_i4.p1  ORF type:complete len:664 (-),score=85.14 TRINITY_DN10546_c0_g1_i4:900-2891(-)